MGEQPFSGEIHDDRGPARAAPRDSMLLLATLRADDGRENIKVRVRNLSATGLMAECAEPLDRDQHVEIDLRGVGLTPAKVVWVQPGRIGLAFSRPIDPHKTRGSAQRPATLMPTYLSDLNFPKPRGAR